MAVSDASVAIKNEDFRVGRLLFLRVWRLIAPYWARPAAWRAWLALVVLLSAVGIISWVSVESSFAMKYLTDALIARDGAEFGYWLFIYFLLFGGLQLAPVVMGVLDSWLNLDWRKWLSQHLIVRYLDKRTYYDIESAGDLDNPDQRIQANVTPFVSVITEIPRTVLAQFATITAGVAVLSSIDSSLIFVAVAFGVVQMVVLYFAYVPTLKQNFECQVAEADFRQGLLHVKENAEAVAFFHGEAEEQRQLGVRIKTIAKKQRKMLYYNALVVSGATGLLSVAWILLPYVILAPKVFSGELTFGSVTQGMQIAGQLLAAVTALAEYLPLISSAAPQAVRLAHIQERFDKLSADEGGIKPNRIVITHGGGAVALQGVSLETPGAEQRLIRDLSFVIQPGESLAIVGQTGVGKSSLLRAIAGLWVRGSGRLHMPAAEECLFLPQRPYMFASDLRSQLTYPLSRRFSDEELQGVLERVSLGDLRDKQGGWETVRDWGRVLSLGEQQRIAFARMLLARPKFAFLDEATSSVDYVTEAILYQELSRSKVGFISVGHRAGILQYHQKILTLSGGGGWEIHDTMQRFQKSESALSERDIDPTKMPTAGVEQQCH